MTASVQRFERTRAIIREDGWLLALATLLLALGPGTVWYALAQRSPSPLAPLLGIVMALPLAGPLLGRVTRMRIDGVLLGTTWALTALGLMVVARVRPTLLDRQAAWVMVGWVAFAAVLWFPRLPMLVARYRAAWFGVSVLLVLATLVIGQDPGESGHRLWLGAGPFLFQPSEALRVATVILLAGLLTDPADSGTADAPEGAIRVPLLEVAAVVTLSIGAVVLQGDLGPAVLLAGSFAAMLYLAGARARDLAGAIGLLAIGAVVVGLASSRAHERVAIWLDPWSSAEGLGYQAFR